jgi:TonB family protein
MWLKLFGIPVGLSFLVLLFPVAPDAQESGEASETKDAEEEQPVITPPELIEYAEAEYPETAFAEGLEAEVSAELDIDENGLVTGVEIKEPAGHGFDEAAEAAMRRFVFAPATRNGEPIVSKIIYRYRFFIQEQEPEPEAAPPPVARLLGTVTNMDGDPVPGASLGLVWLDAPAVDPGSATSGDQQAVTDGSGKFDLPDLVPGSYQVDVIASGFKPLSIVEELEEGELREVIYRLEAEEAIYETVVRARRPAREVTRREITRREITRIPGTGGDALRSVQNMPGMARAPFGSGLLIVRGSSPDDSKYFFDSINVPLLYHFGGLTSVINSDLLESIDFYPGNFGVRYGGATGGIVEVYPRAPATDRLHAYLDADLVDVSVLAEMPLGDKWSAAASVRRSYIDGIMNAVMPDSEGFSFTVAPRYWDYQLIADYHPSARNNLRLFFFGSDDKMVFVTGSDVAANPNVAGNLDFRVLFHQAQANWEHRLAKGLSNNLNVGTGYRLQNFGFGTLFKVDVQEVPVFFRDELSYDEKRNIAFRVGVDGVFAWDDVNVRAPTDTRMLEGQTADPITANEEITETSSRGVYFQPAIYGEVELRPVASLKLIGGVRAQYFDLRQSITLDPRFVARYRLKTGTTFKTGIGMFHQSPAGFEKNESFGNPELLPLNAIHYSLGVEQEITENLEAGIEGFYKDMKHLVVSSDDPEERYNNDGVGKVWGMELLLKHHPTDRFFGWISYTLMKSRRIDHPGERERLFDFDQTHILTVVASLVIGRGWEAGVRFRLVSGNPETPVVGSVFDADSDIYLPLFGPTNSRRLPTFHQLDVRVDKNWKLRRGIKLAVYLDIQNIYNQMNPEAYAYNYDYTERQYFNGLPVLPSLGVKIEY